MYLRWIATLCLAISLHGQAPQPGPAPNSVPAEAGKPASVSGKTVSGTGQALKKAKLTLRPMNAVSLGSAMPDPYVSTSDGEGKFVFEAVEPGRYVLFAERPGFQQQNYGARQPGMQGTVLSLTSGQVMSGLNFTMSPQIVVSGKVLDSDGDPAGHVQVRATRMMYFSGKRQASMAGATMTDENGEYKIQNLNPGKYFLSASPARGQFFDQTTRSAAAPAPAGQPARQEESMVQTFYPGVTEQTAAQEIELTPGHDRSGTDITLRKAPVFHVRGKVAGALPGDKTGLRVTVTSRSGTMFDFSGNATAAIGKDGTFDLAAVSPGSYSVLLANLNGMFKIFGMSPITVANRDVEDVTLAAEDPFDVAGQIVTERIAGRQEAPAPTGPAKAAKDPGTVRVFLMPMDGPAMNQPRAVMGQDGSFTLPGATPGRYRVSVSQSAPETYVKSIRYGDQDALASGLTLAAGASTRLEVTLATDAAKLDGVVQDSEGKPSPGTMVTMIPDPQLPDRNDLYRQSNTDQSGAFSLKGIPPGKYRMYAWDHFEYGNQFDPEYLKNFETLGTKVELAASGSTQVTLKLIP